MKKKSIKQLDKGEIAEILDFYDGTWTIIRYLSKTFNVSEKSLRYFLNYKNYREKQAKDCKEWRLKNPERTKELNKRAFQRYYKKYREEILEKQHKNYRKNHEKILKKMRERYKKNPEKYNKWRLENPEKFKEIQRRYYLKNRERILEQKNEEYRLKKGRNNNN